MGLFRRIKDNEARTRYYIKLGKEVLGQPSGGPMGMGSVSERAAILDAGRREARRREKEAQFGSGDVYGDRNWSEPIHALTADGRPVTVSIGRGPRANETLACNGHVSAQEFYGVRKDGLKGHDHYLPDGSLAADRARYRS